MIRSASILLGLVAAPLQAASVYEVALAAPATTRVIVKDMRWSCAGARCTAPRTASSPDGHVCAAVARKLGRVEAFAAAGRAFDAEALAKCNTAAD